MPTLLSRSRTTALSGALLLTTALLMPSAHAQAPAAPDTATAPAPVTTPDTTTAPAPVTTPDTTAPATAPAPDTTAPAPNTTATPAPAAAPAPATTPDNGGDSDKSHRFRIGPTVGVYLPTSSKTRNQFGSAWYSFGLGFGPISSVTTRGQFGLDLSLQYQQHDGNHVLMVPVGVGYRVALTDNPTSSVVPYAGLTADAYIIDLKSSQYNAHGTHVEGGGSLLLGVNFGNSANIEARYQFVSDVQGFDFSGLSVAVGYRF